MPANRSRTDRWRDCLWQVYERGGGLEIALARPNAEQSASDLVWRVRVLHLSETEIVVEQPAAFGRTFPLQAGVGIVGAMSIGQNKWMFSTRTLPTVDGPGLRLAMPEKVERCQRRSYFRVATAGVELPLVECWPLLDPSSVVAAEVANEAYIRDLNHNHEDADAPRPREPQILPDVGPKFLAKLVNLSGGAWVSWWLGRGLGPRSRAVPVDAGRSGARRPRAGGDERQCGAYPHGQRAECARGLGIRVRLPRGAP
ncbi:MAG: hypothetical protein IPJ41_16155 [Phycisphaerales bacterium]|nr:hypothetical protein [Phycisphaerales bacterium]